MLIKNYYITAFIKNSIILIINIDFKAKPLNYNHILHPKILGNMENTDRKIIQLLSKGYRTPEISTYFIEKGIAPSSVSSIEKRIKTLKKVFGAKTLFHLAVLIHNKKAK